MKIHFVGAMTSFTQKNKDMGFFPMLLQKVELLIKNGGRLAFTERGMRVSNAILSDWLDFGH